MSRSPEAEHVERGRGPHEVAVVERDHGQQGRRAHAHPDQLAEGDAPVGERLQSEMKLEADENKGGYEQRPVDVLKEPAVDPEDHEPAPSAAMATFSRKMAWKIWRAMGAATDPPWPPPSTNTTTTTCGSLTGAKEANQAWS